MLAISSTTRCADGVQLLFESSDVVLCELDSELDAFMKDDSKAAVALGEDVDMVA